jgi:cyanophycinase-like exopeptidase
VICLQGGGEFSPACAGMDGALLEGLDGPVVVTALAGAVGEDYRKATDNGVRHFRALGAADVLAAPDLREDRDGGLAALQSARLLVLPGGSPGRLLSALTSTEAGQVVIDLVADGGRVMGASAGAMVLGKALVLPDRDLSVVPGLGLVPVAVIPHWWPGRDRWVRALSGRAPVLGLAEEAGAVYQDGALTAVGNAPARLVDEDRDLEVGTTWRVP